MPTEHIVKSFDEELNNLRALIVEMGGMVEGQLKDAITILEKYDPAKAKKLIERDKKLDDLEGRVVDMATQVLALRQPFAEDLRIILTALKISSNLERMGDYSKNIAKRMLTIESIPTLASPKKSIIAMSRLAEPMIIGVIDAFVDRDAKKALSIIEKDKDVDRVYNSLFRELLTYMMEDNKNISGCIHLMFIAKNVERIGDHATNIAEQVHFMETGEYPEDERPKRDETPTIVAEKK